MKKKKEPNHTLLAYQGEQALKEAVAEAIAEHKRKGIPIAIVRNGRVVRISAEEIEVREPQTEYMVSRKREK